MAERRDGDALERAWDAVRHGEAPPADVEPWLVETLQDVHARDHVPPLDPIFVQDLREELLTVATVPTTGAVDQLRMPNGRAIHLPLSTAWPAGPRGSNPDRRTLGQLATAAIVLLTLVGSFFAFGPGRLARQDTPVFLPAISGTPATPEAVATETLLDAMTAALPDAPGIVIFMRLTFLQPSPTPLVVLPLTGPVFLWVESGELTATVAGVEHQLAVGDLFSPDAPQQEIELRDTGDRKAAAFLVYLQSGPDLPFPRDPAVHNLEVLINGETDAGLACPCRLHLERLTLPPGTALPPQEASPLTWFALGKGVLGLTLEGENLPYLFESGKERRIHVGQDQPIEMDDRAALAIATLVLPGTPMTLRNAGDDPLVLYRLTLTPSEAEASNVLDPATATASPSG